MLPGHASLDDDEGRGRTALLLASERASTRRLVDVAAALAEGGWDVGSLSPTIFQATLTRHPACVFGPVRRAADLGASDAGRARLP